MNRAELELKAYAKINLGLDVTGRRDDGYHLVRMVMQSVDIFDIVRLKPRDDERIVFSCSDKSLETGDNLCLKAVQSLREKTGDRHGVDIGLVKYNPVAAGMAGGSTDAAAVLRGMTELFDLGLSDAELSELAVGIGADVPFCIHGGTALCEGIGEVLTPIDGMPDVPVLIARPKAEVSTAGIYKRLDDIGAFDHPDIDGLKGCIERCDAIGMCGYLGNVLELVTGREVRDISVTEDLMMECGALGAMMTGSGPTVFGIFSDEDTAAACEERIRSEGLCSFLRLTGMKDRY